MRNTWLNTWDVDSAFIGKTYEDAGYNTLSEKDRLEDLELILLNSYKISYPDLMNWTPNIPVEQLLKADSSKREGYACIDRKFIFWVQFELINSSWKATSFSPVFKDFSDSLSTMYFDKKYTFCSVYSEDSSDKNPVKRGYFIYKNAEGIQCMRFGGISKPFKDVLIKYKENLQSGMMF